MKNEKITNAWNKLDPSDVAKRRISDKIDERQNSGYRGRKQVFRYAAMISAAAAVLCLAVLGYVFLNQSSSPDMPGADLTLTTGNLQETQNSGRDTDATNTPDTPYTHQVEVNPLPAAQNNNSFRLLAYTFNMPGDDATVRTTDIIRDSRRNASGVCVLQGGGYYAGWENIWYSMIGFLYEGENISKVEFSVDEGFLGRQGLDESMSGRGEPGYPVILVFQAGIIEHLGSKVVFDEGFLSQDDILMWGIEATEDLSSVPWEVTIRAKAIFLDDTYAEQEVTLDILSAVMDYRQREIERLEYMAYQEFCYSLSLEDCELVSDSVRPVTNSFEYYYYDDDRGMRDVEYTSSDSFESNLGDDDYFILACGPKYRNDDDRGFMVVIKRDDDGSMIGMIYRTPPQTP